MISLTFSSGPWGPKCLKYQNVPHLGSFWAIGKPWERFQRWDIIIYFIAVLNDHTVVAGGIFPVWEKCLAMEEPASDCWQLFSFAFNFRSSFLERLALPVGACCVPRLCPFWPESDGDVDLVERCGVRKISVQLGSMVNWWILHGLWFCSYIVYTTCV